MTSFFTQQSNAKRATKRMYWLLAFVLFTLLVLVNLVVQMIWVAGLRSHEGYQGVGDLFDQSLWNMLLDRGFYGSGLLFTTGAFLVIVAGHWWYARTHSPSSGADVARGMGARELHEETRDPMERRLINVVQEMAIASGVVRPKIFVIDNDTKINAFAAGWTVNNSAIGITQGALLYLNRDELQGVVAHEFSHIINGDMLLNMRLIILVIALSAVGSIGWTLLWRTRQNARTSAIFITIMVAGALGSFFARVISSRVSREREFLADASSVQFTRNREAIGRALRKLSWLAKNSNTQSLAQRSKYNNVQHMMLQSNALSLFGLFSTHPPLADRIKRIYGKERAPIRVKINSSAGSTYSEKPSGIQSVFGQLATTIAAAVSAQNLVDRTDRAEYVQEVNKLFSPREVFLTMIAARGGEPEVEILKQILAGDSIVNEHLNLVLQCSAGLRWVLFSRALETMRELPAEERKEVLRDAHKIAFADKKIRLAEWSALAYAQAALQKPNPDVHKLPISKMAHEIEILVRFWALLIHAQRGVNAENLYEKLRGGLLPGSKAKELVRPSLAEIHNAFAKLGGLSDVGSEKLTAVLTAAANPLDEVVAEALAAVYVTLDAPLSAEILAALDGGDTDGSDSESGFNLQTEA